MFTDAAMTAGPPGRKPDLLSEEDIRKQQYVLGKRRLKEEEEGDKVRGGWKYVHEALWRDKIPAKAVLPIADTIFFTNGQPKRWLFTDQKDGKVKKKSTKNATLFNIYNKFVSFAFGGKIPKAPDENREICILVDEGNKKKTLPYGEFETIMLSEQGKEVLDNIQAMQLFINDKSRVGIRYRNEYDWKGFGDFGCHASQTYRINHNEGPIDQCVKKSGNNALNDLMTKYTRSIVWKIEDRYKVRVTQGSFEYMVDDNLTPYFINAKHLKVYKPPVWQKKGLDSSLDVDDDKMHLYSTRIRNPKAKEADPDCFGDFCHADMDNVDNTLDAEFLDDDKDTSKKDTGQPKYFFIAYRSIHLARLENCNPNTVALDTEDAFGKYSKSRRIFSPAKQEFTTIAGSTTVRRRRSVEDVLLSTVSPDLTGEDPTPYVGVNGIVPKGISVTKYYQTVKVCQCCYKVYTTLDKDRKRLLDTTLTELKEEKETKKLIKVHLEKEARERQRLKKLRRARRLMRAKKMGVSAEEVEESEEEEEEEPEEPEGEKKVGISAVLGTMKDDMDDDDADLDKILASSKSMASRLLQITTTLRAVNKFKGKGQSETQAPISEEVKPPTPPWKKAARPGLTPLKNSTLNKNLELKHVQKNVGHLKAKISHMQKQKSLALKYIEMSRINAENLLRAKIRQVEETMEREQHLHQEEKRQQEKRDQFESMRMEMAENKSIVMQRQNDDKVLAGLIRRDEKRKIKAEVHEKRDSKHAKKLMGEIKDYLNKMSKEMAKRNASKNASERNTRNKEMEAKINRTDVKINMCEEEFVNLKVLEKDLEKELMQLQLTHATLEASVDSSLIQEGLLF